MDGGQKTRNPLPNPTSRPKKSPEAPRGPPEAPRGPRRRPEAPRRRPERPAGGLKGAPKPKTRAPEAPESPPEAPEAPGRFRSSEGHDRKSPQPFRKILKGYRSARDKTLDQSLADKGGSGNLGRLARNPFLYKVGWMPGVSRGWERETNTPVLGLLRTRDAPWHDMPPPPHP